MLFRLHAPRLGATFRPCPARYSAAIADTAQDLYHYVVVRSDLPRGLQAANIVHAAGESAPGDLPEGTRAVCLTAPDEATLAAVADKLRAAGVALKAIHEPDAPHHGALMAIGCAPVRGREVLRRLLSSLPLLR